MYTTRPLHTGKVYDPMFLFMLGAVLLALACSFMLRAVVTGFGPSTVHASSASENPSETRPAAHRPITFDEAA